MSRLGIFIKGPLMHLVLLGLLLAAALVFTPLMQLQTYGTCSLSSTLSGGTSLTTLRINTNDSFVARASALQEEEGKKKQIAL